MCGGRFDPTGIKGLAAHLQIDSLRRRTDTFLSMSQDSFTAADVRAATQSLKTKVTFLKSYGLLTELQTCVCQTAMKWNKRNVVKDGYTWRCPRADCLKKVSIRHQSFFFRLNLQLPVTLEIALLWAAEVPVSRIKTVTNTAMSVKCVCQHYEYYREICTGILFSNDKTLVLGGYGKKVHVNKSVYRVAAKVCTIFGAFDYVRNLNACLGAWRAR